MSSPYPLVIDLYRDITQRRAAKALSNIDAFLKQTYYQGKTYDLSKPAPLNALKRLLRDDRQRLLPFVHDLQADKAKAIKRNKERYINAVSGLEINKNG